MPSVVLLLLSSRRGYEEGNETAVEFARMAEESGAAAIAVHGRYAQQFYRGDKLGRYRPC